MHDENIVILSREKKVKTTKKRNQYDTKEFAGPKFERRALANFFGPSIIFDNFWQQNRFADSCRWA